MTLSIRPLRTVLWTFLAFQTGAGAVFGQAEMPKVKLDDRVQDGMPEFEPDPNVGYTLRYTGGDPPLSKAEKQRLSTVEMNVPLDELHVSGPLRSEEVKAVLNSQSERFRLCFVQQKPPPKAGKLEIEFTVHADTKIEGIRIVRSTVNHWGFESCVQKFISRLRFAPFASGEVSVRAGLIFRLTTPR